MKSLGNILVYIAFAGSSALAQLAVLPPPSIVDGTPVQSIGLNTGSTHWDDPATLGRYHVESDVPLPLPSGLTWANSAPTSLLAGMAEIGRQAGTVRAIFVGESARWWNDFGYTYDGQPGGDNSFTVFSDIQAPSSVRFGDHVDIALLPGDDVNFDFWFNASDSSGPGNPPPPTANGGVYTVFHQTNSDPYIAPGNVKFAQSPLLVSTWSPIRNRYEDVSTYLITIEDWRLDRGTDGDTTDFIFALQLFSAQGIPFDNPAVPEPSTYGMVGAASLLGLVAWTRRKKATRPSV